MNNKELSSKFLEGIEKALLELTKKKADLNQSFVLSDSEGKMKIMSAKKILKNRAKTTQ
jgi:hypothetical protein